MRFIYIFLLAVIPAHGVDWFSKWDHSGATWEEKWNNTLDSIEMFPRDEQIDILGSAVRVGAENPQSSNRKEVFTRAQQTLLQIQGHAEYYAKKIETARDEDVVENARRAKSDSGDNWQNYDQIRKESFGTMAYLPSLETVQVLVSYLNDVRDVTTPEQRAVNPHYHVYGTNAQGAAAGLSRLIVDFRRQGREDDSTFYLPPEVWQVWAEQVKAGTRTFRLKGDPQDYDFNGPASKETLQRIERRRSREEGETVRRTPPVASAGKAPQPTEGKPPSKFGHFAGCIALAAAVWWFIRIRRVIRRRGMDGE